MFGINGMEQNDIGALTPEQQEKLNEFKVNILFSKKHLSLKGDVVLIFSHFSFAVDNHEVWKREILERTSRSIVSPDWLSRVSALPNYRHTEG